MTRQSKANKVTHFLRLCALVFLAGPLSAATMQCEDPRFTVTAKDARDLKRTCNVISKSQETLAKCGVVIEWPIEIAVQETIECPFGLCLGVYRSDDHLIEVLTPKSLSEIRDRDGAFELISDDAYWDSVLIHELTHAAYDRVPCPFSTCVATAEYASYAMQVHTLPSDQRALFGQTIKVHGSPSRDAISAMMYYFSPDQFAKYAWLHFQSRKDPCAYMQYIMDGDLFFDFEPL